MSVVVAIPHLKVNAAPALFHAVEPAFIAIDQELGIEESIVTPVIVAAKISLYLI
ncbi:MULTISPECIES: hypothetical protein [Methanosarcina]|uniref:hypothetical protein n=1 Tax=Methanosarcina TaxID=2207 RepID=UPI000A89C9DC|nr:MULTISPECIES: hypothetical protein [Methanosarcina]